MIAQAKTKDEVEREVQLTYASYIEEMKGLGFGLFWMDLVGRRFRFVRMHGHGHGCARFAFYDPFPEGKVTKADCINRVIDAAFEEGGKSGVEGAIQMLADKYDIDLRN